MDKATQKRLFTAELQQLKAKGMSQPAADGSTNDVLAAIAGLRQDMQIVQQLLREGGGPGQFVPAAFAAQEPSEFDEVSLLRNEIRAMSLAIQQTKSEIAALRPPNSQDDRLIAVTSELDAIVSATERATHDILEAAEGVEGVAERLQAHGQDSLAVKAAGELHDVVVGLFEACNFQDITGQRITKVVKTLQFIEERVNRMIDIWGAETFTDLPRPPEVSEDDDKRLLNGPALENQGISQADIDKLFD